MGGGWGVGESLRSKTKPPWKREVVWKYPALVSVGANFFLLFFVFSLSCYRAFFYFSLSGILLITLL